MSAVTEEPRIESGPTQRAAHREERGDPPPAHSAAREGPQSLPQPSAVPLLTRAAAVGSRSISASENLPKKHNAVRRRSGDPRVGKKERGAHRAAVSAAAAAIPPAVPKKLLEPPRRPRSTLQGRSRARVA